MLGFYFKIFQMSSGFNKLVWELQGGGVRKLAAGRQADGFQGSGRETVAAEKSKWVAVLL